MPVRALGEIFDKEVGYVPNNLTEDGLLRHAFVWIDEQQPDWAPDIPALKANCKKSTELLKAKMLSEHPDWYQESSNTILLQNIDSMKVTGYIGRYTLVDGSYKMLVDPDGSVYIRRTPYLYWNIQNADFTDPDTFYSGYNAG